MEKEFIIIPIKESSSASNLEKKYLIQVAAYEKINRIISNNIVEAEKYLPLDSFIRKHETITILGERGTGKTSFLLNLDKYIIEENKISFLRNLDPTLFEDKQNIMVTIIASIIENIESFAVKKDSVIYREWQESLTILAEGLNLLDDIGANPMKKDIWDDARIILEKGLKCANSGINFEKNFHIFVFKSLELISKKIFLLSFDDIDTNISKGWHTLEVIRKYLSTPHIQVVISGDWNLYSKVIRLKQWEELGSLLKYENTDLNKTINILEEQYLTKILKPENRIELQNLHDISINNNYKLYAVSSIDESVLGKNKLLKDIYKEIIISTLYILDESKQEKYIKILITLPVRLNIQILKAYFDNLINDKLQVFNFLLDLTNILLTKLNRFNFNRDEFSDELNGINFFTNKLLEMIEANKLHTNNLYKLTPSFLDQDLNLLILVMNVYITHNINKNVANYFKWFFRVEILYRNIIDKDLNINDFIQYLDYQLDISMRDNAIKLSGFMYQSKEINQFGKVYMDSKYVKDSKKSIGYTTYIENIDIKKDTNLSSKSALTLKILNSIVFNLVRAKKSTSTYAHGSIINVMGFLGDVLNETNIENIFKSLSEEYVIFAYDNVNLDSEIYSADSLLSEEKINTLEIYQEMISWKKLISNLKPLPLEILTNIWQEFYTQEESIWQCVNFGDYIKVQGLILFNSILRGIEKFNNPEKKYKLIKSVNSISRLKTNIEQSPYFKFYNDLTTGRLNIDMLLQNHTKLDFFEFILICPIWKYLFEFPISSNFTSSALNLEGIHVSNYFNYFNKLELFESSIKK